MTSYKAIGFIGSLFMRMMGVVLVIADSVPIDERQRDYVTRQRKWYERQQDSMEIDSLIEWLRSESDEQTETLSS